MTLSSSPDLNMEGQRARLLHKTKSVVVCLGHNIVCPPSLYIELVHQACTHKKEPVNIQTDVHLVHTHIKKEPATDHMSNKCFGTMTYDLCTLASVPAHSMQTTLGQEPSPCVYPMSPHTPHLFSQNHDPNLLMMTSCLSWLCQVSS